MSNLNMFILLQHHSLMNIYFGCTACNCSEEKTLALKH